MTSLVELRVLEGPNLYFPRPAVKLTLDVGIIATAEEEQALRFARRIGLRTTSDPHRLVVAYPWRHRERAQVMGRAVADVLDALP